MALAGSYGADLVRITRSQEHFGDHQVPIGGWQPDKGRYGGDHLIDARNVVPTQRGYVSARQLAPYTAALQSAARGFATIVSPGGVTVSYAGDANRVYKLQSDNTWHVLRTYTGALVSGHWNFFTYDGAVYVQSALAALSRITLPDGATVDRVPGAPTARYGAVIREHLVLAGDDDKQQRVYWSAYRDPMDWTPSAATLAGFVDLPGAFGPVQAVVPGEYGVVFQTRAIWRMEIASPPVVFQFDQAETGRGTFAPQSVCWYGKQVFYYGHDGFYLFDGQQSRPIGVGAVDAWFRAQAASLVTVRGTVDSTNKRVLWSFSRVERATGAFDTILVYGWDTQQWSYLEVEHELLGEAISSATTLEQLAALYPAGIDSVAIPLDSDAYRGGFNVIAAFNSAHRACHFSSSSILPARLQTAFNGHHSARPLIVNRARVLVDWEEVAPADVATLRTWMSLAVYTANYPDDTTAALVNTTLAKRRDYQFRATARFFSYAVDFRHPFTQCTALILHWRLAGMRGHQRE